MRKKEQEAPSPQESSSAGSGPCEDVNAQHSECTKFQTELHVPEGAIHHWYCSEPNWP
jgi:hypothetical protein